MIHRNTARKAFTLIEILIVVVILGILAAVVIPQFTNAADDANDASVRTQLQTLRSQIELYRAQNGGADPALNSSGWADLINGGYLPAPPRNPMTGSSSFGSGTTNGWRFEQLEVGSNSQWATNTDAGFVLVANDSAGNIFHDYEYPSP